MPVSLRSGSGAALALLVATAGAGQEPPHLVLAGRRGAVLTRTRHVD